MGLTLAIDDHEGEIQGDKTNHPKCNGAGQKRIRGEKDDYWRGKRSIYGCSPSIRRYPAIPRNICTHPRYYQVVPRVALVEPAWKVGLVLSIRQQLSHRV